MGFTIVVRWLVVAWCVTKYATLWAFLPSRRPEMLRRAFEDLGPTYIKLGQIIASSPGLFPEPYCIEFKKCLDQVPSFPFEQIEKIIIRETGKAPSELFASIDETPIAAASIAQVHGAQLHDGSDVVIKVQRPGLATRVDADLWFMHRGARIAERFFYDARLANVTGIVEDFAQTIHEELDFRREGANMDEFNKIMVRHGMSKDVVAPQVHWDYTTQHVLTMERFYGYRADDIEEANRLGMDSEKWLRVGMRAWNLSMMLHGFFHGDVHAGNLMVLPERNQIGLIDFGIIGRFTDSQRMLVLRYILSFSTQDYKELAQVIVDMNANVGNVDMDAMASDMERVYKPLIERSLANIDYGAILPDIMGVVRKHGIRQPREFVLILKQLLYFDRYAKLAAPKLNVFSDIYLVDFLFQPSAQECGIDLAQVGHLMMAVQKNLAQQPS